MEEKEKGRRGPKLKIKVGDVVGPWLLLRLEPQLPGKPASFFCRCQVCGAEAAKSAAILREVHRGRRPGRNCAACYPRQCKLLSSNNLEIVAAYEGGEMPTAIGRRFGISRQRVYQIINKYGRGRHATK